MIDADGFKRLWSDTLRRDLHPETLALLDQVLDEDNSDGGPVDFSEFLHLFRNVANWSTC